MFNSLFGIFTNHIGVDKLGVNEQVFKEGGRRWCPQHIKYLNLTWIKQVYDLARKQEMVISSDKALDHLESLQHILVPLV